ncbi:MAG: hypothetical protein L3J53_05660 [Proteobacteria bacterium]|nr:hypothetical protein [Pseudomonadota bacterium]
MKKLKILAFILTSVMINFSYAEKTEEIGVLILAHGGKHSSWDEAVKNATDTLKQNYAVEVAFGMANPIKIQAGIDKLENKGVTKIVVVPLFISSYSPIIRQNEYLLGLRDTLADPPMMMHHGSENHAHKKMKLEPLNFKSKIVLTKPLDDHSLVAEIIFDRILELSVNPENETILIVAHGPNNEQDNKNWVKEIDNLADQIRISQSKKKGKFKQIFGLTVRDDADSAIYQQAKEQLRTLVYQSGKDGEVIVIPLLLSQGGVEDRYVERLEGLNYKWSGKTLLPHPNITKFIQISVKNAL